ncbi:MAG: hypothetical protein QI197_08145 [Candidatus Korarchaeota archaeon]|nr:hypothetical protein [Candidatus Korarchaeota archaeon]
MEVKAVWLGRLADISGMMAFFPLLSLISYTSDLLGLSLALHLYLTLTVTLASIFLWKVRWPDPRRTLLSALVMGLSAVLLIAALIPNPHSGMMSNLGTVASMLVMGLYAHSVAKVTGVGKLDRFGGLVVLGSFLIVIRESFIVLIALLLLSLGLGGISQYLRMILALSKQRGGNRASKN